MLMPAPAEPTNRELSDNEWACLVGPLSGALYEAGVYGSTVVNHEDERDAEKWCIMRDSAICDENNNHIPRKSKAHRYEEDFLCHVHTHTYTFSLSTR